MGLRLGVIGSLVVHAGALAFLLLLGDVRRPARQSPAMEPPRSLPVGVVVVPAEGATPAQPPPPAVPLPAGPADVAVAASSSPLPRADVDIPDSRRAAAGGGQKGATEAWTGRHDREELRSQSWNDPSRYRIPRVATARDRASPEAVSRDPDPGIGQSPRSPSPPTRRARRVTQASGGQAEEGGSGRAGRGGRDAADTPAELPRADRPLTDSGPVAVEASRHGRARDDASAAQASDERDPQPFDLTRARAGGRPDGEGVAGPREAAGASAVSDGGEGDGASPLDVPVGRGPVATRARPQDPYLRTLYSRVRERIVWPRRLALAFEQGEVVVHFTLGPAGSVETLRVDRSSGFSEFDDAVVTAIRTAAPFGPPPPTLLPPGQKLQVSAPFIFDNPMIR
jgi:TonB family protein